LAFAAYWYQRLADQGHPDGTNNLGFCFEYGRGILQNTALATEYYKFAADHGHAEAFVNYHCCLCLQNQWEVPDRSSAILHP
jgi:TPR repeat protein